MHNPPHPKPRGNHAGRESHSIYQSSEAGTGSTAGLVANKIPSFPQRRSYVTWVTFFRWQRGYLVDASSPNVRLTCRANSNPKENDHGYRSSRRQPADHAAIAAGLSAAAGSERRKQETGRRAEGVPAGAARTPVKNLNRRRRSSWPEKDRPRIGSAKPARTTGLSPVLWDECELGLAPVAHLLVTLQ